MSIYGNCTLKYWEEQSSSVYEDWSYNFKRINTFLVIFSKNKCKEYR